MTHTYVYRYQAQYSFATIHIYLSAVLLEKSIVWIIYRTFIQLLLQFYYFICLFYFIIAMLLLLLLNIFHTLKQKLFLLYIIYYILYSYYILKTKNIYIYVYNLLKENWLILLCNIDSREIIKMITSCDIYIEHIEHIVYIHDRIYHLQTVSTMCLAISSRLGSYTENPK